MSNDQDYGSKIPYDALWQGPLAKRREVTNGPWLIVMLVYLCIWGGVVFYGFKNGNLDNFNRVNAEHFNGLDLNSVRSYSSTPDKSSNLMEYRGPMIAMFIASAFITIGYVLLMRWFAKFLVYFVIILVCVALIAGAFFGIKQYAKDKRQENLIFGIACAVSFVIIFLALLFLRRKINIACGVIAESMKAVLDLPLTLVFPIIPLFFLLVAGGLGLMTSIYLESINYGVKVEDSAMNKIYAMHAVNVVGMLWIYFFITGFGRLTLAGTFSTWFWTRNKHMVPSFMVLRFSATTIRYHLGTVALGSIIITICKIISYILKSLRKSARESNDAVGAACLCCITCLWNMIEQFIRFITENAYVMCATHGTAFFTSAKDAFNLIMRNYVKVAVTTNVTSFIMMFGRLLVTIAIVGIAHLYLEKQGVTQRDEYKAVLVTIGIGAFLVTECVMIVANTAIDTIFLSALEDFERHDDSSERPYYMNHKLKQLFIKDEYRPVSTA